MNWSGFSLKRPKAIQSQMPMHSTRLMPKNTAEKKSKKGSTFESGLWGNHLAKLVSQGKLNFISCTPTGTEKE